MSNRFAAWPANPETLLLVAALLGALGCSDDSHRLGGISQEAQRPLLCVDGAEFEFVDHMEDRDGAIEMVERRAGVWFSFNDKSGGSQFPASDDETFVMSKLDPPREDSHYAARSYGFGFGENTGASSEASWGAGIGFELYCQKAYDLSRYAGITFWAKRAPDGASALRFAMTDSATTPRGGKCETRGGYPKCSNYFGVDLNLSTTFQRYSFSWQELSQEDWGVPGLDSITTSEVYGIRFQTKSVEAFDFWIDDIALLCRPE